MIWCLVKHSTRFVPFETELSACSFLALTRWSLLPVYLEIGRVTLLDHVAVMSKGATTRRR